MSSARPFRSNPAPLQTRAQAAAWLAALRGPQRTPEMVGAFRQWLAESAQHRQIWEEMNEGWDLAGALQVDMRRIAAAAESESTHRRKVYARAAAVAVAALLAVGAFYALPGRGHVETTVGEQRMLTLADGTRVSLNTQTRLRIRYDRVLRHIELQQGEARFDVARDPARVFIVTAAGRSIRALGTSFLVRHDERIDFAVTLLDGKVMVTGENGRAGETAGKSSDTRAVRADASSIILAPGQRLQIGVHAAPALDRPALEGLTAWQRGEVAFDQTPLAEAVAEMNRYSATVIRIEGASSPDFRISGLFRAGDSLDFARGVAQTFGFRLVTRNQELILAQ
jgi:transmembrane sensor